MIRSVDRKIRWAIAGENVGGLNNVLPEVLPLYEKACAGGIAKACPMAESYRAEKARRSMPERPDP